MRTRAFPATLALLASLSASGCSEELGDCDAQAARELVYGQSGLVATKGQALLNDSCGNAAFCHSSSARGENRLGAPSNLNFDMLPRATGWPSVVEHADEIWSSVLEGQMPPTGDAAKAVGNGDWTFDPARAENAQRLPTLETDEGKAVLRNWLACGAPVVAETQVPLWAQPGAGELKPEWSAIYNQVIRPRCASSGCHNMTAAGTLPLVDECSAYRELKKSSRCQGKPRIAPGSASSYLLDTLESNDSACNVQMPPTGSLPATELAAIRAWVEAGAAAPNCE